MNNVDWYKPNTLMACTICFVMIFVDLFVIAERQLRDRSLKLFFSHTQFLKSKLQFYFMSVIAAGTDISMQTWLSKSVLPNSQTYPWRNSKEVDISVSIYGYKKENCYLDADSDIYFSIALLYKQWNHLCSKAPFSWNGDIKTRLTLSTLNSMLFDS